MLSAIVLTLSISVKLIPLMFLPLFFQWFVKQENVPLSKKIKNLIGYYSITCLTTIILFAPFYSSQFISNYSTTVALWFQNFEFNASIYYIARAIGYYFSGYNLIAYIGAITPIIVVLFILYLSLVKKQNSFIHLISAMLLTLSFYYFTTTTVHPWYIATLLILSIFTNYKYPLVWSFVIILSYLAYINLNKADKSENLWIIALEYTIVYSVFIWEVFIKRKSPKALIKGH
jgi:uncharacterized membrane protein